jgi:hypothetical protein
MQKRARVAGLPELKCIDYPHHNFTITDSHTTNDSAFICNRVSPGTAHYQRASNKIMLRSLRVRGQFQHISQPGIVIDSHTLRDNFLRLVVVYDRFPKGDGTMPTFNEIFKSIDGNGLPDTTTMSPLWITQTHRYRVLRDLPFHHTAGTAIPYQSTSAAGASTTTAYMEVETAIPFDFYLDLDGYETIFNNNGIHGDITAGAIYLYCQADHNISSVDGGKNYFSLLQTNVRLRYTDA